MTNVARNSDRDFENLTSRAFRSDDDLAALLLVEELSGVGKALGSAILRARDPARYTVTDVAAQAIQSLGYFRDLPSPRDDNNLPAWDRYLAAARDLALRTGWTLRDTDRALFTAGQTTNAPS
jgi:FtsZ-interacting cell division protein ZipA